MTPDQTEQKKKKGITIYFLVLLLQMPISDLYGQALPTFQDAIKELNSAPPTTIRLTYWLQQFSEKPPQYWQLTTAEYISELISLSRQLVRLGRTDTKELINALDILETEANLLLPDLIPLLDEIAIIYRILGNYNDAASLESRALEIAEIAYGPSHLILHNRLLRLADDVERSQKIQAKDYISTLRRRAANLENEKNRQSEKFSSMGANPSPQAHANSELVTVFFATNRAREKSATNPSNFFGPHRTSSDAELNYGHVLVSVPRAFEINGIRDGRFWVGEIRKGDYKKAALVDVTQFENKQAMASTLRKRVTDSTRREIMVFVHGYSTDWKTAVQRTAALAVALELDGAPFLFSWPSRGDLISYAADGNELTAVATAQLANTLETIVRQGGADHIYIVAHSMGSRFLLSALERLPMSIKFPSFDRLIFASPDVDSADFSHRVPSLLKFADRTTLYVSKNDRALLLSSILNDSVRAGDAQSPAIINGMDTIDTTRSPKPTWSLDGLIGHEDFSTGAVDDLRALVWHNLPPSQRCLLGKTELQKGILWNLRAEPSCPLNTFKMGIHATRRLGPKDGLDFLRIQERETCNNTPASENCQSWRRAREIASNIKDIKEKQ